MSIISQVFEIKDSPATQSNQGIIEILIWIENTKKSNNYILDEGFKKHIDSFFEFTKSLQEKGVKSINQSMYEQALINSPYLLVDTSTCVGEQNFVKQCKMDKYLKNPVHQIIYKLFYDLWNYDEKKRIAALEAKNLISKQQAEKLQAEQDKAAKIEADKLRLQNESKAKLVIEQKIASELAKKEKNKKLMIGGAIAVLTIISGIIAYKKFK